MQQARVFRVGPLGPGQFLYVPVLSERGELRPEHLVSAADDRAGLDALRARLPGVELRCAPELSVAAGALGLPVVELTQPDRELRADVALAVAGEAALPPSRPLEARRTFLRGLGIFSNSPAFEHACVAGARLSAAFEGDLEACPRGLELQATPSRLTLRLTAEAGAEEHALELSPTPGFAVAALGAAYRLAARPAFAGPAPSAATYTALGAALFTFGAVSPEVTEREVEVEVGQARPLIVRARLLGSA